MSGLGFTHWGALVTSAFGVSLCTVDYARAEVATSTSGLGNAGNITINSSSLLLQNSAQITAVTFGQGDADTIKVNATDLFTISSSSSNINTDLFVNSQSTTGSGGNIVITSRFILDNSSGLNAQSSSSNGGNISINVPTGFIIAKPVPEPTSRLSVFMSATFYAAWRLKRKQKQTYELKA
ncbi:hypothetical protein N0Y54_28760 [Nostoc punctiforme UO1]|uniref:hypothetical protein n=1 Tax=Nostoc punctiforme TaxID=272131 RepID=UPI003099AD04